MPKNPHNFKVPETDNPPPTPNQEAAPTPTLVTKPIDQWTAEELIAKLADKTLDNMERHAYASRLTVISLSAIQAEAKAVNDSFVKVFADALIGTQFTVDRLLVGNKVGAVKLGPVGATRDGKLIYVTVSTQAA